jgi:putative restriction endonuclease
MKFGALTDRFDSLATWSRGDQRAPHKPLLVLYALGRWQRGETADIPFIEVEPALTDLLKEFGPPRQSFHPEYPFWRLQNDGVWTVTSDAPMRSRASNTDPPKSELLATHARGGFSDEVKAALTARPDALTAIATSLLERHFPESLHPDILDAVGLTLEPVGDRKRDPKFRLRILTAYESRCAVCGFDVRLGDRLLALEAAHIRWHQSGGPSDESNGLALCALHHKAFDLGAFGVSPDGVILVSDRVNGSNGLQEWLLAHHGKPIRPPQRPDWAPRRAHLEWHGREVFKGSPRFVQ